jgi:hypothetical protein
MRPGMSDTKPKLRERELEDDYLIFAGFLYVVDGKVMTATGDGTVGQMKRKSGAKSITSCDIGGRDIWHLAI